MQNMLYREKLKFCFDFNYIFVWISNGILNCCVLRSWDNVFGIKVDRF